MNQFAEAIKSMISASTGYTVHRPAGKGPCMVQIRNDLFEVEVWCERHDLALIGIEPEG